MSDKATSAATRLVRVSEQSWREAASRHAERIRELIEPGLLPPQSRPAGASRSGRKRSKPGNQRDSFDWLGPLDPQHPVYNFLIEYYGLKGTKGPRRLLRWSPRPGLLIGNESTVDHIEQLEQMSGTPDEQLFPSAISNDVQQPRDIRFDGILLEGAGQDDAGGILHLRGASFHPEGIVYSPKQFFEGRENDLQSKAAAPYVWYRSVLESTLAADPILHCHGLHEWAMQYWPEGADPPPSAKYQAHLPLRVDRETINAAVERRGISCTHVDALRYFAPAAGPLNKYGAAPDRQEQLRLEQPACVHAQMDLLKMTLRLCPFCDPVLLQRVLRVALEARRMDVAASPYDATAYGVDVIPIETPEGRALYREKQTQQMHKAEPVRRELLRSYDLLLDLAF